MTKQRDFNDLATWIPAQMKRAGIESVETLAYRAGSVEVPPEGKQRHYLKRGNPGGLSRTAIYNWMSDACRPSTQSMAKVCRALGVELSEGLRQYSAKRNGRPPERGDNAERKIKRKNK